MTTVSSLPLKRYKPGEYLLELHDVPSGSRGVSVSFDRPTWPEGKEIISIDVEFSPNGGERWVPLCEGVSFYGGATPEYRGKLLDRVFYRREWPAEWVGNSRWPLRGSSVRVRVTVHKSLRTAMKLEAV